MTDPIKALIDAAERAWDIYRVDPSPVFLVSDSMEGLSKAVAAAKAAAEARPEPKPDDACDFYAQLPKGPTHGRFSASDRADLDNLKRKAFEKARPEPKPPIKALIAAAQEVVDDRRIGGVIATWKIDALRMALFHAKAAAEARPEPKPDSAARDWPEDFADENGNYSVLCSICQQWFLGYKRRVACKVCATKEARPDPAAEPIIIPALRKVAIINCDGDTSRALDLLCDAVEAHPEPAAEPSRTRFADAVRNAREAAEHMAMRPTGPSDGVLAGITMWLCDAVEALAREVPRG